MDQITEDHFLILDFISDAGKGIDEVHSFNPADRLWNNRKFSELLSELEWAGLTNYDEVKQFYTLAEPGKRAIVLFKEKQRRINEEKELQLRKLKIDVENAERINATYWWTFWFAVLGFAISLLLAILKITGQAN